MLSLITKLCHSVPHGFIIGENCGIRDTGLSCSFDILSPLCFFDVAQNQAKIGVSSATKFCQQLAAQSPNNGGIYHITTKNASVHREEQEVPAFIKTHDYFFNKKLYNHKQEPAAQLIKSASTSKDIPYFLKTNSGLVESMRERRLEDTDKKVEAVTPQQLRQASVEPESVELTELHGVFKRVQNKLGEDGFS